LGRDIENSKFKNKNAKFWCRFAAKFLHKTWHFSSSVDLAGDFGGGEN
jgi:hypothetical protein